MTPLHITSTRRATLTLLASMTAALLAGCGTSPPVQLYHLPAAAPQAAPAMPAVAADAEVWQLMAPVRVPDYLDREALLLPQGRTGLLMLSGHRWAETLRDAVPRVLKQDLATLRGESRVWTAPLPPGVAATRQLRVELLAFEAEADRSAVRLQARWTLADAAAGGSPSGAAATAPAAPPVTRGTLIRVPAADASVDALVAAHRLALWQLAVQISATR